MMVSVCEHPVFVSTSPRPKPCPNSWVIRLFERSAETDEAVFGLMPIVPPFGFALESLVNDHCASVVTFESTFTVIWQPDVEPICT